VLFFTNVFSSLEDEMVRGQALRLVSLPLWHALSPGRLQLELHAQPALAKRWKALAKKDAKAAKEAAARAAKGEPEGPEGPYVPAPQRREATFVPGLVDELLGGLEAADAALAAAAAAAGAGAVNGVNGGGPAPMEGVEGAADGEGDEDDEDGSSSEAEEEQQAAAAAAEGDAAEGAEEPPAAEADAAAEGDAAGADAAVAAPARKAPRPAAPRALLLHVERCVELVIDLLSQLPTRRFVHAVLDDRALLVKARLSALYRAPQGDRWVCARQGCLGGERRGGVCRSGAERLGRPASPNATSQTHKPGQTRSNPRFRQLLDLAAFYLDFPIDDHTSEPLGEDDVAARHYDKARSRGGGAAGRRRRRRRPRLPAAAPPGRPRTTPRRPPAPPDVPAPPPPPPVPPAGDAAAAPAVPPLAAAPRPRALQLRVVLVARHPHARPRGADRRRAAPPRGRPAAARARRRPLDFPPRVSGRPRRRRVRAAHRAARGD
jgi:hypothetical protein